MLLCLYWHAQHGRLSAKLFACLVALLMGPGPEARARADAYEPVDERLATGRHLAELRFNEKGSTATVIPTRTMSRTHPIQFCSFFK